MPPPMPPAKAKSAKWKVLAAGVGGLILGIMIGSSGHSSTSTTTPALAPSASSSAAKVAPAAAAPAPAPARPATSFGDGTYTVPDQIGPGSYQTDGKGTLGSCYYERAKDTSGEFGSIISNGNASGPTTVTIKKSDGAFQTTGGCTWTKR